MPSRLLYLIVFSGVIRMIVAALLELSNDEVYYYLYALELQPNYFDHPPGVGILIRIFTLNLLFTHEFFIRLGAIVCAALGTYFSYRLGSALKNEQTGWFAAIIYNTSIYTSVIAGTFIIPDSPQVVFWLGSLWVMFDLLQRQSSIPLLQWLLFGLLTGLCVLCKVHGIFLWFGLGLYILLFDRKLLANYGLYLAALVTIIVISPILIWNVQNDFITYRFHSGRVGVQESIFHFDYFFQSVFGQLLYNNPVNAILILISIWKLRSMTFLSQAAVRFIMVNGLPIILVVTGMSLFNSMLPHWSGPGFMTLGFLAAAWLDEQTRPTATNKLPAVMKISASLIVVAIVAATLLIKLYPGTFGSREQENFGDGDFTLDMYGWKQFSTQFKPWLKNQKTAGRLPENIRIVSDKWFPAAHLDYYVATPAATALIGVGDITDLHQYYWLNKNRPDLQKGDSALLIIPSNYPVVMENGYLQHFAAAEKLITFSVTRSGSTARYFMVFLLKDYQKNDEVHAGLLSGGIHQ